MSESDAQLTAYCGFYCGDCIHYRSRRSKLTGPSNKRRKCYLEANRVRVAQGRGKSR
jgi:hypothetical protein